MNMPVTADPIEIKAAVQNLRDKGIAGVEIGQGAFPNNEQLVALLSKANELGIKVSLSHGPTQNPAGYSIDDDNARKTLAFGNASVDASTTFEGPLPQAHPPARPQFGPPLENRHRLTSVADAGALARPCYRNSACGCATLALMINKPSPRPELLTVNLIGPVCLDVRITTSARPW